MGLEFSPKAREKLSTEHGVTTDEVLECFYNRSGNFLRDERDGHESDPPIHWFISCTDKKRVLKVMFMVYPGIRVSIKSAYQPSQDEIRLYNKHKT